MSQVRDILFLLVGLVMSLYGLIYGLICVAAPRKAIAYRAKTSLQLSDESSSDRGLIWKFRAMGVAFVLAGVLFTAGIVHLLLSRL